MSYHDTIVISRILNFGKICYVFYFVIGSFETQQTRVIFFGWIYIKKWFWLLQTRAKCRVTVKPAAVAAFQVSCIVYCRT